MKVVSIAIQKGGSGKTTTAINLAAALRDRSKRVLLIDLDPQANLTQSLGIPDDPDPSLYHVLKQECFDEKGDLAMVLRECNGLDLIPSSLDLAMAELELVSIYGREKILSQLLQRLNRPYDFVLIDCPPSFGMLTVNALVASDLVLLPLQAEFLPLKGVRSFMKHLQKLIMRLNPNLLLLGFVLTRYDYRKSMNQEVLQQLKLEFGEDKVFDTYIRSNIDLAKAQQAGTDIFTFKPATNGARDYAALAEAFLKKIDLL